MSTTVVLTAGCVLCIIAVIIAVARRDPATAAAGILGALILGILAILGDERDRYDS
jgi:hypothetical protein